MKHISENKKCHNLYQKIRYHQYISFEDLALQGFSIREFRQYYHIDETEYIDIYFDNGMYGNYSSFQDDNICLELAWCRFHCKDQVAGIAFDNSVFSYGYVDFSYSIFDYDLVFDHCTFDHVSLYFIGCIFQNGDFSFFRTSFKSSNIYIHVSQFFNQEISYIYSSFDDTYLQFVNNECNNSSLLFSDINENGQIDGEYLFLKNKMDNSFIDFQNTYADKIIFYDIAFNNKTNLNICFANHIIIQQCINRDIMIIGNEGYKNITHICLKDTVNFGQIIIKNEFSKKLFIQQKKLYLDPTRDTQDQREYYQRNLTYPVSLCDTSDEEKYMQFTVLQANETMRGNSDLNDKYYLLARKYKNRSKVTNQTIKIAQLKNSKEQFKKKYFLEYIIVLFQIATGIVSYCIEKIILETLCGSYATRPYKFLVSVIVMILIFTHIYLIFDIDVVVFTDQGRYVNALIYSLQNFFPVGILTQMQGPLHLITVIEEIIGTIILALFTASFTRKVIR